MRCDSNEKTLHLFKFQSKGISKIEMNWSVIIFNICNSSYHLKFNFRLISKKLGIFFFEEIIAVRKITFFQWSKVDVWKILEWYIWIKMQQTYRYRCLDVIIYNIWFNLIHERCTTFLSIASAETSQLWDQECVLSHEFRYSIKLRIRNLGCNSKLLQVC